VQAVLFEGKNRVRIYEPDGTPPEGFEAVPATLEDAYLLLMPSEKLAQAAASGAAGGAAA